MEISITLKCYRCASWPCVCKDGQTIIHGDCREVLPLLPRVDLVLTDPPYGIGFDYKSEFYSDDGGVKYQEFMRLLRGHPLALLQYPEEMMALCVPILGVPDDLFAWCYNSNTMRQFRLWGFLFILPQWDSVKQPPKNPGDPRVAHWVRSYDWCDDIQQTKNVSTEKTEHPCQLPVRLVNRVLSLLPSVETVADPFLGSGTTLVACKQLGRKGMGIEIEERYCEIAANRLRQEVLQFEDCEP